MKKYPTPPCAAALASLLFAATATTGLAQVSSSQPADPAKTEEVIVLEEFKVTTGTRIPKAVDQIPGAITLISMEDVKHTQAITEDATAVLARSIPGYAESSQALSNTGETLRGRTALRLFDGIPMSTPLRETNRSGTFTDMMIIDRIEVINGASSAEGIGASGGVINYISKSATKMGEETTVLGRVFGQGRDDSAGWKAGINFAHKEELYDLFLSASHIDRGISYDGNGRRIGLNTSGSVADSKADNLFVKLGTNFGKGNNQRLVAKFNRFELRGNGKYHLVDGDRDTGETNTSEPGAPLGAKTSFNDMQNYSLSYQHYELLSGSLTVNAYRNIEQMRFEAEDGADRQDPDIAPIGTLIDQSEVHSSKWGVLTSWHAKDFLKVSGLDFNVGVDIVEDETEQSLALTNRLWVPPMVYSSTAPFVQLGYTAGPVTLSGGVRHEDGELSVDSYTTTYYRNRVFVTGGTLGYKETLPNAGLIVRLPYGFSTFLSYSKGFGLPNVGIPLRNVNYPGQSVEGILDLQALIADNTELGLAWRGKRASVSASIYRSESDFGVSLAIDPITNDFVMRRQPVEINGGEITADYSPTRAWKFTALYARILGKTAYFDNGPLEKRMGVLDVNPDKIGLSATWKFSDRGYTRLGSTTLLSRDLNVGKGGEEHTSGYTLFDLSVNYSTRFGETTLGVENLFDKFYILSWSQVVGYRNFWSGRGRMISLSQTLKF